MTPGMMRNQKKANGVTTSATITVTSSARVSVLRGFLGETSPTDPMTTTAWMSQRTNKMPSAFTATRSGGHGVGGARDRKSTRLNSSHTVISYAVFCLKKKKKKKKKVTIHKT